MDKILFHNYAVKLFIKSWTSCMTQSNITDRYRAFETCNIIENYFQTEEINSDAQKQGTNLQQLFYIRTRPTWH